MACGRLSSLVLLLASASGSVTPGKCPLTQLEEDMARYTARAGAHLSLPTLAQLEELDPGERFVPSEEDACHDRPEFVCPDLARLGTCNGTNHALEAAYQDQLNRTWFHEAHGFHLRDPGEVSARQVDAMQVNCRPSCLAWQLGLPPGAVLSPELASLGGYSSTMTDIFGEQHRVCRLGDAMTRGALSRIYTLALSNLGQGGGLLPAFHPRGFQKVAIPREMYARILTGRKKALREKEWLLEPCDPGMQNCARVVESLQAKESHMVHAENYFYLGLDRALQQEVFKELRGLAQAWIGGRVELVGTAIYGIRRYSRGAKLMAHLDHLATHVISAILNIAQEVDEPWPLQILDHSGAQHRVLLRPGQMVWYESASLAHARSRPLNGSSFENMFVHFMPRGRWYDTDWELKFGRPDPRIRLEDLEMAAVELQKEQAVD